MPENFLWGSGYAGHQVEGNNTNNQWWLDEEEGRLPEKSGLACNSYEMFETDVALVEKLGHKSFRTSVEWCRIEPEEGVFNEEAVIISYHSTFVNTLEPSLCVPVSTLQKCRVFFFCDLYEYHA